MVFRHPDTVHFEQHLAREQDVAQNEQEVAQRARCCSVVFCADFQIIITKQLLTAGLKVGTLRALSIVSQLGELSNFGVSILSFLSI